MTHMEINSAQMHTCPRHVFLRAVLARVEHSQERTHVKARQKEFQCDENECVG